MSKKMEDFFNISPLEEEYEEEVKIYTIEDKQELIERSAEICNALSMIDKIELALPTVEALDEHNGEMDDISKKAIDSFQDLMSLGKNVQDIHAGKIYEVASTMLKTALEAKNAKAEKKLRMIELQLKKARLDQMGNPEGGGNNPSRGGEFDRNELMKYIVDTAKTDE